MASPPPYFLTTGLGLPGGSAAPYFALLHGIFASAALVCEEGCTRRGGQKRLGEGSGIMGSEDIVLRGKLLGLGARIRLSPPFGESEGRRQAMAVM